MFRDSRRFWRFLAHEAQITFRQTTVNAEGVAAASNTFWKDRGSKEDSPFFDPRFSFTQLPLLKWGPIVPDHYRPVICSVARICFKDECALLAQPVILRVVYKSAVSPLVSRVEATLAFVGEEVVSVATLSHRGESTVRQVAKLAVLRVASRGFGLESSREKRSPHIGISDIARLRGARAQPQHDCCSCERAD
jgi:hypothetical protein